MVTWICTGFEARPYFTNTSYVCTRRLYFSWGGGGGGGTRLAALLQINGQNYLAPLLAMRFKDQRNHVLKGGEQLHAAPCTLCSNY